MFCALSPHFSSSELHSHDTHPVKGAAARWGAAPSQTANEDPSSIRYRFSRLNPLSEYEVAAEYVARDNALHVQDMDANGSPLYEPLSVTMSPRQIKYIKLRKEAYKSGEVTIGINARGEESAIVSQLWLKELGKEFKAEQLHNMVPSAYRLDQNYPNPFNPSTTIRYGIPIEGHVTLKVFDTTGREVVTLVNEKECGDTRSPLQRAQRIWQVTCIGRVLLPD